METAPIEKEITFKGFENVKAGIVKWPLSVIRISGEDKNELVALADKILSAWRGYTDENAFVFAETNGEPHNTITPIARRRGEAYELDLVLRCNITTAEHPMGVFHPHGEKHHIKKENIGLIEVMGLAVLPSRLKKELTDLAEAAAAGVDVTGDETLGKHAPWLAELKEKYTFTSENAMEILLQETGKVFAAVLEDAGVYKNTPEGRAAFLRFVERVNREQSTNAS
jgi:UDPglucose--hexose-1-phosphate uridylyltransferase